jgi:hypothetical protein
LEMSDSATVYPIIGPVPSRTPNNVHGKQQITVDLR